MDWENSLFPGTKIEAHQKSLTIWIIQNYINAHDHTININRNYKKSKDLGILITYQIIIQVKLKDILKLSGLKESKHFLCISYLLTANFFSS